MSEEYVRDILRTIGWNGVNWQEAEATVNKSHKKDMKEKYCNKIKNNKDKKNKNKDKSEKKRIKEEIQALKQKIKKEKNEIKKQKLAEGLVPKLTLKLNSSNSNSPMPSSSPDVFKLIIKPVEQKTDDESPSMKEDTVCYEHCRLPRKQKHSTKHNHVSEVEAQTSSLPSGSSFLRKDGHFDEETASRSEEATPPPPSDFVENPLVPLPTPYYVDKYGFKIWVCPACRTRDNGSPMIGCDSCDAWYHFICVGITEEPGLAEDWFCKDCAMRIAMDHAGVPSGKKKGRKPKTKKFRTCN